MPDRIPQSVAIRVPLKAYLASDHLANATGKTIAVQISKNGAAFGNPSAGATNAVEIGAGWYYADLSAIDAGALGPLIIRGTSAGVDDVEIVYQVVDALSMGAGNLDAPVSSRSTYAGADTAGTATLLGRIPGTVQPQTGDAFARLGLNGAGLTVLGDARIANLDAAVSSRSTYAGADTAGTTTLLARLTVPRAANLDFLDGFISTVPIAVWVASNRSLSNYGTLPVESAAAVWSAEARTLTAFNFAVNSANLRMVWDEPLSDHTVAGSTGEALTQGAIVAPPVDTVAIAETLLTLDWNTVSGEAERSTLNALRAMRNGVSIVDNGDGTGTITVRREDDTAIAWTATCEFNGAGLPIAGVEPA
jgi:hypothetical protein